MGAIGLGVRAAFHAAGGFRGGTLFLAAGFAAGQEERGGAEGEGEQFDQFHLVGFG